MLLSDCFILFWFACTLCYLVINEEVLLLFYYLLFSFYDSFLSSYLFCSLLEKIRKVLNIG